jgi:hypothetical protein
MHFAFLETGCTAFGQKISALASPEIELKRILDFLGYRVEHRAVSKAVVDVFATSIGKGMATLGDEKIQRVFPHIIETHQRLGYA